MKPLFAATIALALSGCFAVKDSGGGSRFIQSDSPTGMGTAIITRDIGFQDTLVAFDVLDPKTGDKPIALGFVGDATWQGKLPHDAIWSKDGSVVAVRGADFKTWSHAYDFKTSRIIEDLYVPFRGDIEKLLKIRGGLGPKVLANWTKFDEVAMRSSRDNRR